MDTFFKEDGCFCLVVRDAFYQKITIAEYVWAPFILFFFLFLIDFFYYSVSNYVCPCRYTFQFGEEMHRKHSSLTEEMISLFPKEVDYTTGNQEGDEMVRCSNEYAGQQGFGIQFIMINISHDAYLL